MSQTYPPDVSKFINAFKFGITKYITKGPYVALKSKFGDNSSKDQMDEIIEEPFPEGDDDYSEMSDLVVFVIIILSIIFGFIAVNNICKVDSERGKNTRLGLYVLLILSGGMVGWLYILLWVLKIDVCT